MLEDGHNHTHIVTHLTGYLKTVATENPLEAGRVLNTIRVLQNTVIPVLGHSSEGDNSKKEKVVDMETLQELIEKKDAVVREVESLARYVYVLCFCI